MGGGIKSVPPNEENSFDKLRGKSQSLRHCPPQACVNYARMSAPDWRSSRERRDVLRLFAQRLAERGAVVLEVRM